MPAPVIPARDSLRVVDSLSAIDPAQWNALAGDGPFMRHEFLSAMLETGCASARTGWAAQFITLWRGDTLTGAIPLFVKSHSYGEYVFDWSWADAYSRHGKDYYPKLLCAVPFTPVTGPRVLAANDADRGKLVKAALEAAREFSSLHVLFPPQQEAEAMGAQGLMLRRAVQFHWQNTGCADGEGYADFEDFLSRLSRQRRKVIRQERRRVHEAGVTLRRLPGAGMEAKHWQFFNRCYRNTYAAHGSSPYLNLDFFLRLGETMPDNVVMVLAERAGKPIAASLLLQGGGRLYGRYWGALEHVPLLHFECCYYQPIEHAIETRMEAFEGGAQGEHKLFRGLMPVETCSAHWISNPAFAQAVETFLSSESARIHRYVNELQEHTPFKAEAQAGSS